MERTGIEPVASDLQIPGSNVELGQIRSIKAMLRRLRSVEIGYSGTRFGTRFLPCASSPTVVGREDAGTSDTLDLVRGRRRLRAVRFLRPLLVVAALALAVTAGTLQAAPPKITSISCDSSDIYDNPVRPHNSDQLLFGYVALPSRDAYVGKPERDITGRHRYASNTYLLVHTGTKAVTFTVPQAWRRRFGINFGDSGNRVLSALRVPPCRYALTNGVWNEWGGDFSFNVRACVPLVVRVGTRSTTVRFSLGKRC